MNSKKKSKNKIRKKKKTADRSNRWISEADDFVEVKTPKVKSK